MLARNSCPKAYVDDCRASIDAQLVAYKALKLTSAPAFERLFFNNLVVVLDRLFVHRTRGGRARVATHERSAYAV
jgi:hypothetical protein